jgi:RND family efflux transporter MFP subunit
MLFIFSCQTKQDPLSEKKALLSEKKTALRAIQKEIDVLSKEILKLDPPKEKSPVAVKISTMQPNTFKRFIDLQGKVEADDIVNVSSEIGGRIINLNVKEGQAVRKGQLIAVTDMSTLENQIAEINNNLEMAKTVFERQERLWKQNIGSEIQYLQAKTNKEGIEKSLETLKSQIKKKNVYAPISGIVDKEFLKQGETASPGMPMVQILNTSKIKVVADAQEQFLKSISKGDMVEVTFPALGQTVNKKISMIGRTIDPANRTFKFEIETNSMNGQLKPNLLAEVKINDYTKENVIVIPLDAIQEEVSGKKFVYLMVEKEGENRAQKSYIELGESTVGETIISSGLKAGDNLIVAGGKNLSNGDLVTI